MTNLNLSAETLPSGTCFTTVSDLFDLIENYITAVFPDTYALINYGSSTPPVDQQDRPWVKLNSDGSLDGLYVYYDGSWQKNDPFTKGDVIMFSGASGNITTPWAACVSGAGTINGVVVPDLSDKFIVGAYNSYSVGDTGGSASVTLSIDQIPSHTHAIYGDQTSTNATQNYVTVRETNTTLTVNTGAAGGGLSHENRPPYYALGYKIYVGYS